MSRSLIIVPCSARKNPLLRSRPLPARLAYAGQAFLFAREYIEAFDLPWIIISAKFGILWPEDQVSYYDCRLYGRYVPNEIMASVPLMPLPRRRVLLNFDRYICLGGAAYVRAAGLALEKEIEAPLAGMGIGKMLHSLKWANWDANNYSTAS